MTLVILFSVSITAAILLALFYGYGDWLIDTTLIGFLFFAVASQRFRVEAAIGAFVLQCLARRLPWWARALAMVSHCHGLLSPVLFPGAVETLDTEEAAQPIYNARFMSSAKRVIRERREKEFRTRQRDRSMALAQQYARTPGNSAPAGTPVQNSTLPIDGEDAQMAAMLFGMGKTPAQVARLLAGYSGSRNAEFVAKAEALKSALNPEPPA